MSQRLGHVNVTITLGKYSYVTPNIQTESAENFSKALKKNEVGAMYVVDLWSKHNKTRVKR